MTVITNMAMHHVIFKVRYNSETDILPIENEIRKSINNQLNKQCVKQHDQDSIIFNCFG